MNKFTLVFSMFFLIVLAACDKQNQEDILADVKEAPQQMTGVSLQDVEYLGESHNQLLEEAELYYTTCEKPPIDEHVQYKTIKELQNDAIEFLPISEEEMDDLKILIDSQSELPTFEECYENLFPDNDKSLIQEKLVELYGEGLISYSEKNYLNRLLDAVYDNVNGITTYSQFSVTVNALCVGWNNLIEDASTNAEAGQLGAITIAISKSSRDWWIQRDYATNNASEIPAFIAYDACGAIEGALIEVLNQKWRGNKRIEWKSVGVSALWSAVQSSTGGLMKLAKYIRRF